jgi:hypothetical protein
VFGVNIEVVTLLFGEEVVGAESLLFSVSRFFWRPRDLIPPSVEILLELCQIAVNLVDAVVQPIDDRVLNVVEELGGVLFELVLDVGSLLKDVFDILSSNSGGNKCNSLNKFHRF